MPVSDGGTLSKEQLKDRLRKIIVGKDRSPEDSWRSGEPAVAIQGSLEDIHEAKVAAHEIYEQNHGNIRMVSATSQACQEEAVARLLADQMDYDLLPAEAFAIGEEARHAHREYRGKPKKKGKPADQRLKDAASTAKSKAKVAAAKDEALLAGLQQQLTDIDERLAADRRELACTVPPLSWPARRTVIKVSRPPTAAEAEESAVAKLRRLRATVVVAEEHAAATDADAVAASRLAARAKQHMDKSSKSYDEAASFFKGRRLDEVSDKEWQTVQEWQDEVRAEAKGWEETWLGCVEERRMCDDALDDALEALDEARDAVAAAERAQARQEECAKAERELEDARRERAEAAARLEALTAQVAAMTVRRELERAELAEGLRWRAEEQRAGRWPPEKAFGVEWKTPPAQCKTISLVGVSPEGLRSLAAQAGVAAWQGSL